MGTTVLAVITGIILVTTIHPGGADQEHVSLILILRILSH
jgi:hypothetical protein